jgi:hypothetical protein
VVSAVQVVLVLVLVLVVAVPSCGAPRTAPSANVVVAPPPASDVGILSNPGATPGIFVIEAPPHDPTVARGDVGRWREGGAPPKSTTKPLAVSDEPAPGRTDSGGQIFGYCPPRARIFDLGDARSLVTREPCSGVTEISIRERVGDRLREQRVADSLLLGVVGEWRIVPLARDRLLMISQHTVTNLQLVDLSTTRARWIRMPVGLERAQRLQVGVVDGSVYVWGGSLEQTIGESGCGNPQPNQGCDPVPVTKLVPNPKVWVWSLQ